MGTNDKQDIPKNLIEQEINAVMMMPARVREKWRSMPYIIHTKNRHTHNFFHEPKVSLFDAADLLLARTQKAKC
jgi:hypothetical protein